MVFKAELRPAEVDPGFDICRVVNEPLQKNNALKLLVREV